MANPKHFSRSLSVTTAAMAAIYCGTSAPLYIRYGSTVASEVLYGLSDGWMRTVAGAAMFLHVCVSYIISSQLVNRAIHVRLAPQVVGAGGRVEATQWLFISIATGVSAWLLANIIPFFAQLLGILASFCMAPLAFGFPAFFYLIAARKQGLSVMLAEKLLLYFMLALTVVLVCVGGVTNIMTLVENFSQYGLPFSCVTEPAR